MNDSKRETWKFLIQVVISILTAIATALGTTSCMRAMTTHNTLETTITLDTATTVAVSYPWYTDTI